MSDTEKRLLDIEARLAAAEARLTATEGDLQAHRDWRGSEGRDDDHHWLLRMVQQICPHKRMRQGDGRPVNDGYVVKMHCPDCWHDEERRVSLMPRTES